MSPGVAAKPARAEERNREYPPIRDYAVVGDGRTAALIARDGTVEWLCLPDLDSASVFASMLDRDAGGRFALAPDAPFEAARRYLPDTNVLETTFTTATGIVRVIDAMLLPAAGLAPHRELARRVECLAGEVPMRWSVEPRLGYATEKTRIERRLAVPIATAGSNAIAVRSWGAEPSEVGADGIGGHSRMRAGSEALFALGAAHGEPMVLPSREQVEGRFAATESFWRRWSAQRRYNGPWREAVLRSALALKLLIYSPSGAIAAAATTSLPEGLGGVRNWDYRYTWVRDSTFTVDALLRLGCPSEAGSFFWWLLHASQLTHPRLHVLYRLNGGIAPREGTLPWDGYRGSRPVRIGNAAESQLQLDLYGHLLATAQLYCEAGGKLDRDTARRLADTADLVCREWHRPDSGIWEVRDEPRHFTESKMMCWVALDRAIALAEGGLIPARRAARWRHEAMAVREFVEARCWSEELGSYVRFGGASELDASLLLGALMGYGGRSAKPRLAATTRRIADVLGDGVLMYRYLGDDGLPGDEGAFLACSFWLVEALAREGRVDEAAARMDQLVALANDVGLYAEEVEPESGEFLGNFPQALVHLALINAAASFEEVWR